MKSDMFFKVIVSALTLLLAFGQYRLSKTQESISKAQVELAEQEIDTMAVSLLRDYIGVLDSEDNEGVRARMVLSKTATHLTENYGNVYFAQLIVELMPPELSIAPPGSQKSQEAAVFQISEATEPAEKSDSWFAVLTSYSESQLSYAQEDVERFREKLKKEKPEGIEAIGLYLTRINKNYAVTLGGELTKEDALDTAKWAREKNWSETAFAQIDRDWVKQ